MRYNEKIVYKCTLLHLQTNTSYFRAWILSIFLFSLCGWIQLKYRCGHYPRCTITKVSYVGGIVNVNNFVNVSSMFTINVDNGIIQLFESEIRFTLFIPNRKTVKCFIIQSIQRKRKIRNIYPISCWIFIFNRLLVNDSRKAFVFVALRPFRILDE